MLLSRADHIDIVSRFGARLKEDEVFLPRKSRTLIKPLLKITRRALLAGNIHFLSKPLTFSQ